MVWKRFRHASQELMLVLGAQSSWCQLGGSTRRLTERSPLSAEEVWELCRPLSFRSALLLLEAPWVQTVLKTGIRLADWERQTFVQAQFPRCTSSSPEEVPLEHFGVWTRPQGTPGHEALLGAQYSKQTAELLRRFADQGIPVFPAPLALGLLLSIPEHEASGWILTGLEQSKFLQVESGSWVRLEALPRIPAPRLQALVRDRWSTESTQTLRLTPEPSAEPFTVSLEQLQNRSEALRRFVWFRKRQRWRVPLPELAAALLFIGLVGAWLGQRPDASKLERLQTEVQLMEQQIEQHLQDLERQQASSPPEHTASEKTPLQEPTLDPLLLRELLPPQSAWLEALHLKKKLLELNVLTLTPKHIPKMLLDLESHPQVATVELRSRSTVQLQGQTVTRMRLVLTLQPPPHP